MYVILDAGNIKVGQNEDFVEACGEAISFMEATGLNYTVHEIIERWTTQFIERKDNVVAIKFKARA